nr:polyamine n-acetyltransferase 1 [Quercus suber]
MALSTTTPLTSQRVSASCHRNHCALPWLTYRTPLEPFLTASLGFPYMSPTNGQQFTYRLRACGHLSLGIFTSHDPTTSTLDPPSTTSTATAVYSGHPSRRAVLIGLICATLSTQPTVTDAAMTLPTPAHPAPATGHDPAGRTLCLHSLAILPAFQHRGLGRTLLHAYLQRMRAARVADRVALIAHEALLTYYQGFGFRSLGRSAAQFGGGGWWDMALDFTDEAETEDVAGAGVAVGELEVEA